MSVARPARSLLRCLADSASKPSAVASTHGFHSSTQLMGRRKPRFANIQAEKMGLGTHKAKTEWAREKFPDYDDSDRQELTRRYTPEQLAALEAAEQAVSPMDLTVQGRLRDDPYRFDYLDDFSTIQPVVDKRPKTKPPPDMDARFMNYDEFSKDFMDWVRTYKKSDVSFDSMTPEQVEAWLEENGPSELDMLKYWEERSSMTDGGRGSNTALAPALPRVPGVEGKYRHHIDPADDGLDDTGIYTELKKKTRKSVREIIETPTKVLVSRTVSNQTRLGKVRSISIICMAGNGNGRIGMGEAKSTEQETAIVKAKMLAIQNMLPIPRYESRTIYGNVESKISGSVVQLFSRPPGFGLRVPARIFEICRLAGIYDLAAKMPRSRSPYNTVKATYQALMNQPDPEEIALGRGKKLVDVRKVYYGGAVY